MATTGKWGDEPPDVVEDAQIQYARGVILPRITIHNNDDRFIDVLAYNSERDHIPAMVRCFDNTASQIGTIHVQQGRSAVYRFDIKTTAGEFLARLAPPDIRASYPLFHGLFDSTSNIRLSDAEPRIILRIPNHIFDLMSNVVETLFPHLTITRNEYIIRTKETIMQWRDAIYFTNHESYNYVVSKENQINVYIATVGTKNFKHRRENYPPRNMTHTPADSARTWRNISEPPSQHVGVDNTGLVTQVRRLQPDAIFPQYASAQAAGADVYITRHIKTSPCGKIHFYGTGYSLQPPNGYYYELIARSSLPGKGYTLANCTGVIDADYRGELIVQLTSFNSYEPISTFPMNVAQLILRKMNTSQFIEVSEHTQQTERGTGGFGSTDNK